MATATDDHDPDIRAKLIDYLDRTVTDECQAHIEQTYVFGSLADGRFARPSDVDVFFVMNDWDYPGTGDINMVCMSNVPEAVEQGLGKQPGDWWTGRRQWGKGPDAVTNEIPDYLTDSMRAIIAEPFRTSHSQRWVDVFFGSRDQLNRTADSTEPLDFPR